LLFYSTASSASNDPTGSARIGGFGGGVNTPFSGPSGMVAATDGAVSWPVSIVAPYNGTLVTLTTAKGAQSRGLDASDETDVDASSDAPVTIHASKPVIVVTQAPGTFFAGLD